LVTSFVQVSHFYIVMFLPFFAGGFLYLGASDLLPHSHETNPRKITTLACLLGFVVVFILAQILNI
jgi:zinc transporter ZupT